MTSGGLGEMFEGDSAEFERFLLNVFFLILINVSVFIEFWALFEKHN